MKKGKLIGLVVITAGLLTGCMDHMPDMSEEQSALIAEYAADMLLKYSPNYDYKIADEEVFVEEETNIPEEVLMEGDNEETAEVLEVSVTSTVEKGAEQEPDVPFAYEIDFAENLDMEDVEIRYDSMEVCSAYPEGADGSGFSVNAANGNSLIVLHMTIENTSEAVITCDLFEKDLDVSMKVNGGNYKKASNTLLINDFATYMEEIPVGESREAVIVIETSGITEEEITSGMLRMTADGTSVTAKLK